MGAAQSSTPRAEAAAAAAAAAAAPEVGSVAWIEAVLAEAGAGGETKRGGGGELRDGGGRDVEAKCPAGRATSSKGEGCRAHSDEAYDINLAPLPVHLVENAALVAAPCFPGKVPAYLNIHIFEYLAVSRWQLRAARAVNRAWATIADGMHRRRRGGVPTVCVPEDAPTLAHGLSIWRRFCRRRRRRGLRPVTFVLRLPAGEIDLRRISVVTEAWGIPGIHIDEGSDLIIRGQTRPGFAAMGLGAPGQTVICFGCVRVSGRRTARIRFERLTLAPRQGPKGSLSSGFPQGPYHCWPALHVTGGAQVSALACTFTHSNSVRVDGAGVLVAGTSSTCNLTDCRFVDVPKGCVVVAGSAVVSVSGHDTTFCGARRGRDDLLVRHHQARLRVDLPDRMHVHARAAHPPIPGFLDLYPPNAILCRSWGGTLYDNCIVPVVHTCRTYHASLRTVRVPSEDAPTLFRALALFRAWEPFDAAEKAQGFVIELDAGKYDVKRDAFNQGRHRHQRLFVHRAQQLTLRGQGMRKTVLEGSLELRTGTSVVLERLALINPHGPSLVVGELGAAARRAVDGGITSAYAVSCAFSHSGNTGVLVRGNEATTVDLVDCEVRGNVMYGVMAQHRATVNIRGARTRIDGNQREALYAYGRGTRVVVHAPARVDERWMALWRSEKVIAGGRVERVEL